MENDEMFVMDYEFEMGEEELYKVEEYSGKEVNRIYIRKYGEKRGFNLYFRNSTELKDALIIATIDNKKLKQKLQNVKRALR